MAFDLNCSAYDMDDELGEFLGEVKVVFKAEMDRQIRKEAKANRGREVEQDAVSAHSLDLDREDKGRRKRRRSRDEDQDEEVREHINSLKFVSKVK